MADNLARFARLSQQAKLRAALGRDAELTPAERDAQVDAERVLQEQELRIALEAAGPPNGCDICYQINRVFPWTPGCIDWDHKGAVKPQTRLWALWKGGKPEETTFCTHDCHGPEGLPLPILLYA